MAYELRNLFGGNAAYVEVKVFRVSEVFRVGECGCCPSAKVF